MKVKPIVLVHVAGIAMKVQGRLIQRCAVCGEKLCDSRGQAAPLKPDGSPPDPPQAFAESALVRVERFGHLAISKAIGAEKHTDGTSKIPDGFCLEWADSLESLQPEV